MRSSMASSVPPSRDISSTGGPRPKRPSVRFSRHSSARRSMVRTWTSVRRAANPADSPDAPTANTARAPASSTPRCSASSYGRRSRPPTITALTPSTRTGRPRSKVLPEISRVRSSRACPRAVTGRARLGGMGSPTSSPRASKTQIPWPSAAAAGVSRTDLSAAGFRVAATARVRSRRRAAASPSVDRVSSSWTPSTRTHIATAVVAMVSSTSRARREGDLSAIRTRPLAPSRYRRAGHRG